MAAPAGNSFSSNATTANVVVTGSMIWNDCRDLLTVLERMAIRQAASVDGYSNTQIAYNIAFQTYSNTGNFAYPTARFIDTAGTAIYNANTTIQGIANCIQNVLTANT